MRYSLIFSAYPGTDMNVRTNTRYPTGVVAWNPSTRIEVRPAGGLDHELLLDAVRIGRLVAIVRDCLDEQPVLVIDPDGSTSVRTDIST